MSPANVRSTARALRLGAERARFSLWARRLDARLHRAGGRLKLDAPHGAHFYELPAIEIHPYGGGAGTLTIRLGEHVQLGRGLILDVWAGADNALELGDRVTFRAGTRVQLRGGTVRIGSDSTIRDYCLLDAMDGGVIALGERVQFGAQVALHALERVELGDDAAAGERVSVFDSDHRHDGSKTTNYEQPVAIAPVIIGTNTFLGANSLLLRGVRMGPNGMLGGSSLVRGGEYPGGFLYAGSPAREIRPLAPDLGARPAQRR
ncbi:MAG TPA: acyltransferase [Solirubrobacteraceae bacterium]|nr:acyltransferase [Solirubrobacteraceae bacterium]